MDGADSSTSFRKRVAGGNQPRLSPYSERVNAGENTISVPISGDTKGIPSRGQTRSRAFWALRLHEGEAAVSSSKSVTTSRIDFSILDGEVHEGSPRARRDQTPCCWAESAIRRSGGAGKQKREVICARSLRASRIHSSEGLAELPALMYRQLRELHL